MKTFNRITYGFFCFVGGVSFGFWANDPWAGNFMGAFMFGALILVDHATDQ